MPKKKAAEKVESVEEVVFDESTVPIPKNVQEQADNARKLMEGSEEPGDEEEASDKDELEEEPEEEPGDSADEGEEGFEHKYNVIKGMHDADKKRDGAIIEKLNETVDTLISAQKKQSQEEEVKKSLSPEDYEDYSGLLAVVGDRIMKSEAAIAKLQSDVGSVSGNVKAYTERQLVSEQEVFDAKLAEDVPDWQVINAREDFKAFCTDPEYRAAHLENRQDVINRAITANNPGPIIRLFEEFKEFKGIGKGRGKKNLRRDVVPRTTGSESSSGDVVPTITREEFTAATKEFQRGKISEEEFNIINKKFQTAIANNAIK